MNAIRARRFNSHVGCASAHRPARNAGVLKHILHFVMLAFALSCAGCASNVHAEPTTKPSADTRMLRLSDAVDLATLTKEGEPNLSHQLHLSRGGRVYFGTIDTFDNDDKQIASLPIIARKNGDTWRALAIRDPRLKEAAWSYVGGGPNRGEVWGVLDAALDDDQPDLMLGAFCRRRGDVRGWSLLQARRRRRVRQLLHRPGPQGPDHVVSTARPRCEAFQARLLPFPHGRRRQDLVRSRIRTRCDVAGARCAG